METTGIRGWLNRNFRWILPLVAGFLLALIVADWTGGPPEGTVCTATADGATCTYTVQHTQLSKLAYDALTDEQVAQEVYQVYSRSHNLPMKILGYVLFLGVIGLMVRAKLKARRFPSDWNRPDVGLV